MPTRAMMQGGVGGVRKYKLRLCSGRIVEPGAGGFFWVRNDGSDAGGIHDFEFITHRLADRSYGGVYIGGQRYGVRDGATEFIPVGQIESVVALEDAVVHAVEEGPYR